MDDIDVPDVREDEWEPWLELLSKLHTYRSWNRFRTFLIRNLELLTGAQQISVFYRSGSGDVQADLPIGQGIGAAMLATEPGEVRFDGDITSVMAYASPEFSAWLVFVAPGRWNLAQILRRVSLPMGGLLARAWRFERLRSSLEHALASTGQAAEGFTVIGRDDLATIAAGITGAAGIATILITHEATGSVQAAWWDPASGLQSAPVTVPEILVRIEAAIEDAREVSLRAGLAEQFSKTFGDDATLDWYYFVPVKNGENAVALVGAGISTVSFASAPPPAIDLLSDLDDVPRTSNRRMEQGETTEELRVIAQQIGRYLSDRSLRDSAFTDGMVRERTHLGNDLHDSLLQDLTYLQLQLGRLEPLIDADPDRARTMLEQVQSLLTTTSREARELSVGLTSSSSSTDLFDVLEPVAERFRSRFDGRVDVKSVGASRPSPASLNAQVMRILQEVLNNVWKHAAASRVSIELGYDPDSLHLLVTDNGRGFVMEDQGPNQLGLRGIQDRAHEIGAAVDVKSELGKGTTVTVRIPA
ncbi:MAG TPA: hypothetical protein DEV93_22260 [Chloroflexi bacterium]|jgi:signal transduction histidine kinase|nr:hypothetical protein [Chloroflexota bacterium]